MMRTPTPLSQIPSSYELSRINHLPRLNTRNDRQNTVPDHQRLNGFERPFSRDQVITWIGHSISGLSFFIGATGFCLYTDQYKVKKEHTDITTITMWTLVAVVIHIVNSIILVISWKSCETIDPAAPVKDNSWSCVRLYGPRWERTRYCALCRKSVPGLDHHCTWLQTCIGKANYVQFFMVASTGTVQFVLQVVYAILCLLWLHYCPFDDARTIGYVVKSCLFVCLIISVPCMFMYFVLMGFHLWLMVLGYGTYDWILYRRKEQRAKLEARNKKTHTGTGGDAGENRSSSTRESVSFETCHAVTNVDNDKLDTRA